MTSNGGVVSDIRHLGEDGAGKVGGLVVTGSQPSGQRLSKGQCIIGRQRSSIKLQRVQSCVRAASTQQGNVRSLFDKLALIEYQDAIRMLNG